MKCFYHIDPDGECSAAIVYRRFKEGDYIPVNYNKPFPFEKIAPGEKVIIVDFSLTQDGVGHFEQLEAITTDIIWIDHHATAIAHSEYAHLFGLRQAEGKAACHLTWEYFFPGDFTPAIVNYVEDFDIWRFAYGKDTEYVNEALKLYNLEPTSSDWREMFDDIHDHGYSIIDSLLSKGRICVAWRKAYFKQLVDNSAFYTTFEGHKCIACNATFTSSLLYESVQEPVDIKIVFYYNGTVWTVSLYTENKLVDVGAIAKKHGGGGHSGAAGLQCTELPFKKESSYKS